MAREHNIRAAGRDDRDAFLSLINSVWTRPDGTPGAIEERLPWLFTRERIGNHLLCLQGGDVAGVVGVYPFRAVLNGTELILAGIGQVVTRPECRGQGIMSALLNKAGELIDTGAFDGSWLGGDYRRYARYGWGACGTALRFRLPLRNICTVKTSGEVRPFELPADFPVAREYVCAMDSRVVLPDDTLLKRLTIEGAHGWQAGGAFVLFDRSGTRLLFAGGPAETVAGLLGHQARILKGTAAADAAFTCELPRSASPLTEVCRTCGDAPVMASSFKFRIGGLARIFNAVVSMTAGTGFSGAAPLCLRVRETGETAALEAGADGRLKVTEGNGLQPYELARHEAAELLFGLLPPAVIIPGLRPDDPLVRMLPLGGFLPSILRDVV